MIFKPLFGDPAAAQNAYQILLHSIQTHSIHKCIQLHALLALPVLMSKQVYKIPQKPLKNQWFFNIFRNFCELLPRCFQDAPKMPQDASKMPQDASKLHHDASKVPQDTSQNAPRFFQDVSRCLQDTSDAPQYYKRQ